MRLAFPSLLVAVIAIKTVSARGNLFRHNNGDHAWSLFEEESMSTDYMISPLFSYGGTVKGTTEESIGGGDTWMTIGKSGKIFKSGKSIKPKEL